MKVSVKAYGNLRRYLKEGGGQAELLFDAPVSVGEVLLRLGIPVADAWRISVNGELISEDHLLRDGDVVSVFSPVGGG